MENLKKSKAPDGQGPLLTNYKPKLWEDLFVIFNSVKVTLSFNMQRIYL